MSFDFQSRFSSTISADLVSFLINNVSLPYVSPTTAVCNLYGITINRVPGVQVRVGVAFSMRDAA